MARHNRKNFDAMAAALDSAMRLRSCILARFVFVSSLTYARGVQLPDCVLPNTCDAWQRKAWEIMSSYLAYGAKRGRTIG
eukprot:3066987-Pleurochrysis_carterae.AAC.3